VEVSQVAKPIEAIPVFKGKAARWLTHYLKTARIDPAKQERARQDQEVAKRVKPLPK
jgi:hypothetical protein